jgi:hypothetical protein
VPAGRTAWFNSIVTPSGLGSDGATIVFQGQTISFSADNNALGVKPVDSNAQNPYPNSGHAGMPESFKPYATRAQQHESLTGLHPS